MSELSTVLSDSAGNNVESADAVKTLNVLKDTIANSEYARAFASWPVEQAVRFLERAHSEEEIAKVQVRRQYIVNLLSVMAIGVSKKLNYATRTGRRIQPLSSCCCKKMFLQC